MERGEKKDIPPERGEKRHPTHSSEPGERRERREKRREERHPTRERKEKRDILPTEVNLGGRRERDIPLNTISTLGPH